MRRMLLHDVTRCLPRTGCLHSAITQARRSRPMPVLEILFGFARAMSVASRTERYQVPDFHVAVAVAADLTLRSAAATAFAAVKVNFRAGAQGPEPCSRSCLLCQSERYTAAGIPTFFVQDFSHFHGPLPRPKSTTCPPEFQDAGQKFPCPCGCLYLEVVAERKSYPASQSRYRGGHHVLRYIRCADTLLAGGAR